MVDCACCTEPLPVRTGARGRPREKFCSAECYREYHRRIVHGEILQAYDSAYHELAGLAAEVDFIPARTVRVMVDGVMVAKRFPVYNRIGTVDERDIDTVIEKAKVKMVEESKKQEAEKEQTDNVLVQADRAAKKFAQGDWSKSLARATAYYGDNTVAQLDKIIVKLDMVIELLQAFTGLTAAVNDVAGQPGSRKVAKRA